MPSSSILDSSSLSATLDNVNDAIAFGKAISTSDSEAISLWIAGRVGMPQSYAGMPAPTDKDYDGVKLYTGETLASRASIGHILGEEACRILLKLGSKNPVVTTALSASTEGMLRAVEREKELRPERGFFCCGTCSPAYWRHLAAGGLSNQKEEFDLGMKTLKAFRQIDGGWRRFPFHWTMAALVEIGKPAVAEIRANAKRLERVAGKSSDEDLFARRRQLNAVKALELI